MENPTFRNTIFRPLSTCFVSKCMSYYSVSLKVYIQLTLGDEYVNISIYEGCLEGCLEAV